jgi:uncharacterized glyoxalase superfamily protein PhnB
MKLRALTPMLRTWNLPGSIQFYVETLGFTCDNYQPDWGWASLSNNGVKLMLSVPNAHEGDKQPTFTGSLYFYSDDVDSLWQAIRDKARVSYALETFDYGMREFAIYDNNGYLLQFGQEVLLD